MLIVQEKFIETDILSESFLCNLNACKGACCWEGDFGAPLEEEELEILAAAYPYIKSFISEEGRQIIAEKGTSVYYKEDKMMGTPLLENGACAFMTKDENGTARCGIEAAWKSGATAFQKPLSCHLYPIRIEKDYLNGFETLRYDRWDICSAACKKGREHKIKIFEFAKAALIRKYGEEWYDELEHAYEAIYKEKFQ